MSERRWRKQQGGGEEEEGREEEEAVGLKRDYVLSSGVE